MSWALPVFIALFLARSACGSELSRQIQGEGARSLRQIALDAVIAIGNPPVLYWAIGLTLFSILIVVSVLPLFVRVDPGGPQRSRILRVVLDRRFYGLLVGLAVVGLRWPLFAPTLLNTDEGHSIACAMKLGVDPIFWRAIDGTTGGPLLYYPLLLARLVGLPIEYGSARAIGLLALIGSVLLVYGMVRRLFDEGIARLAVLPLATSLALTTSHHFAHYSSEQIPVFLLTLALYLLVRWWRGTAESDRTLVLCGLVLGSIPFAKLQAAPIGLFIAGCGILIIASRSRHSGGTPWKRMSVFVASGLAVPVFFVIMVVGSGVWRDFWQSYVLNNLGYGGRYMQFGDVGMPLVKRLWVVVDRSFWTDDLAGLMSATMLFSTLGFFATLVAARRSLVERVGVLSLASGWLLISLVAVALPNTFFSHYFLFLPVPVALFGAVWLGLAAGSLRDRFAGKGQTVAIAIMASIFLALTVVLPFDHRLGKPHPVFSRVASIEKVDGSPVAEIALGFGRVGEPMAVWGWQPWRYVETGLYPATRDTQTQWQILETPQRPYYQKRFIDDLLESRPPVLVDTVGYVEDPRSPWRPVFWNREVQAHDAFAEIAAVVDLHYRQVGEIGASRVYVSRSRLAEMERLAGRELANLESQELLDLAPRLARLDLGVTP